jgi:predicted dehydrogenase
LREKPASHAGAIARNRETALVAGADGDAENLAAFGALWRLPKEALFSDAEAMLDGVKPDIVNIAADTEAHIPLLKLALSARVPVIVLEKPVGVSVAEARGILGAVDEAERTGTSRIVVNHERRFAADYRRARDFIRSGELGRLMTINARLYMGKAKASEKVLWHDGTHLVDVMSFLAGPWDVVATHGDVTAVTGNFFAFGETRPGQTNETAGTDDSCNPGDASARDATQAASETAGEEPVSIVIEASPGRDHLAFELDLSFSEGRIRVGNGVWEVWKSEQSRYYENFRSLALVEGKAGRGYGKTGYFSGMMVHAVDLFRNPTLPGESTFRDGLAAIEILDRIITMANE